MNIKVKENFYKIEDIVFNDYVSLTIIARSSWNFPKTLAFLHGTIMALWSVRGKPMKLTPFSQSWDLLLYYYHKTINFMEFLHAIVVVL